MEKGVRFPQDLLAEAKERAEGLTTFNLPQVDKFRVVGVKAPATSEVASDPEKTDVEESQSDEDKPIVVLAKAPPRPSKSAKAVAPTPARTRNPPPRVAKSAAKAGSDVEEVPPLATPKVKKLIT